MGWAIPTFLAGPSPTFEGRIDPKQGRPCPNPWDLPKCLGCPSHTRNPTPQGKGFKVGKVEQSNTHNASVGPTRPEHHALSSNRNVLPNTKRCCVLKCYRIRLPGMWLHDLLCKFAPQNFFVKCCAHPCFLTVFHKSNFPYFKYTFGFLPIWGTYEQKSLKLQHPLVWFFYFFSPNATRFRSHSWLLRHSSMNLATFALGRLQSVPGGTTSSSKAKISPSAKRIFHKSTTLQNAGQFSIFQGHKRVVSAWFASQKNTTSHRPHLLGKSSEYMQLVMLARQQQCTMSECNTFQRIVRQPRRFHNGEVDILTVWIQKFFHHHDAVQESSRQQWSHE